MRSSRIRLLSPAKLNLFLKVLNKRPDGFHNICTVFERIDLSDVIDLKINPTGAIRIHCDHPQVPCGPKNLAWRAARLLQNDFGIKQGVDIHIRKNIPVAAGLGGGSGNAATVLKGLNRLWRLHLPVSQLLLYARQLGSDVAFFIHDFPWALGTRRGDHIQKLDIKTRLWHVLVVPCVKMYSGQVYEGLNLRPGGTKMLTHSATPQNAESLSVSTLRIPLSEDLPSGYTNGLTKRNDNASIFIRYLRTGNVSRIGRSLVNDLESVVLRFSPHLGKLEQRLKSLDTEGVMVSGSGPCVFAVTKTGQQAREIQRLLSRRFSRVFVAKTM